MQLITKHWVELQQGSEKKSNLSNIHISHIRRTALFGNASVLLYILQDNAAIKMFLLIQTSFCTHHFHRPHELSSAGVLPCRVS